MSGFLSGSTALTVYKADTPDALTAAKLKQYAFQPIDDLPEPKGWGWTNIDDMFDTEWNSSVPEKGSFVCFGFRIDNRKVSPAILKKHLTEAYRKELEKLRAEGKDFISKTRKKELKEQHTQKLLSQTEPAPTSVDVALDSTTGLLYVGTTSSSILASLEEYMETSFGIELRRLTLAGLEEQTGLEDEQPLPVVQLLSKIYRESLSVCYDGHNYTVAEAGQATLTQDGGSEVSVKNAPESADAGLEAGYSITKLKIQISQEEEGLEWEFTLNSEFSFFGLKTPKIDKPEDDDPDAALLEKLYLIGVAVGVMHTLFRQMWEKK